LAHWKRFWGPFAALTVKLKANHGKRNSCGPSEIFKFEEKDYFEVLSKFFLFNTGTFSGPELLETLRKYAIKD
jgi:hypothetical protein